MSDQGERKAGADWSEQVVSVDRPRIAPWLMDPIRANRPIYVQVILAAVMINMFALVTSLFTMTVYDRVVPNAAMESLLALVIGAVIVLLFDFILKGLRGYFIDIAGQRIDEVVGASVFNRLVNMQMASKRGSAGALAGVVREFETLRDFFASATVAALVDVPFIALFLLVIFVIGGPVVLVPLVCVPLALLAGWLIQPGLSRLTQEGMNVGLSKQGVLVETIAGMETVKATNAGEVMAGRWQQAVSGHADISRRTRFLSQLAINAAGSLQQVSFIGVVVLGVFLIRDGTLSMGGLIACSILAGRCVAPLGQIASLLSRLSHTVNAYRQIDSLMGQAGDTRDGVRYLRRDRLDGDIAFRNVTFRYPGTTHRALDDVSFEIKAGERVAILGRVGSGKSTITRLMSGLYEPADGAVLLDNTDLRQIHPQDLRRNMGMVLQDIALLSGTIRENIAIGAPQVGDEEIVRAATIAGVHDFVGRLPNGYDVRLADRGEGLSGGQRQAIALARALLARRPLLLMDEPTSMMDVQSENALIARLEAELKGRTLVLVTHRAAMLKLVDRVIILDAGKIVAQGPRDDVLKSMAVGSM